MSTDHGSVDESVIELLDLAKVESPFAPSLVTDHRRRLVRKLLQENKIDQDTADYLLT